MVTSKLDQVAPGFVKVRFKIGKGGDCTTTLDKLSVFDHPCGEELLSVFIWNVPCYKACQCAVHF